MKIVGISGGSGAGKSTVSRGLAKRLPNAVFIDVDPFFREATEKLESEVFKKIGVEKKEGVINQNYFFASQDAMNGWIEVIKDYVSNRIEEAVTKLGAGKDFVIVDWCYLPMCDYFFKCNLTLCIKADYQTRYDRLANRMKAIKSYTVQYGPSFYEYGEEAFANRVKFSAIDDFGYQSDYVIKNDSDMESLNKTIDKIADNLMEMSRPNINNKRITTGFRISEFSRQKDPRPIVQLRNGVVIADSTGINPITPKSSQIAACR